MVEAIATLLNTLIQKVLFNNMTMFLFFLFVSFYFMSPELMAELDSKTPPFFPEWLPFSAFGAVLFTCFCTMIWILLKSFVAMQFNKHYQQAKTRKKMQYLIANLS